MRSTTALSRPPSLQTRCCFTPGKDVNLDGERRLTDEKEPMHGERGVAIVAVTIGFVFFAALAVFTTVSVAGVPRWIRVGLVLAACFFGWLLFFAPARVRVAVARWFPWC